MFYNTIIFNKIKKPGRPAPLLGDGNPAFAEERAPLGAVDTLVAGVTRVFHDRQRIIFRGFRRGACVGAAFQPQKDGDLC